MRPQILGILLALSTSAWAARVEPVEENRGPIGEAGAADQVKVAVVQWNAGVTPIGVTNEQARRVMDRNREALGQKIREAAQNGAKFVVAPEFAIPNYPDLPGVPDNENNFRNRADILPYVEERNGATAEYFGRLARELGIYIHVGYAERDALTDRYFNSVLALDSSGAVVASYRKVNLFHIEGNFVDAGREALTYESPVGRVGLLICADVYCSPLLQAYRQARVDVLVLSTSWAQENTGMSYFVRAARSVGVPLLAANQSYYPDSGVINADGTTQSHIRQSSGIAYGFLAKHEFDGQARTCAHAIAGLL
jgi:predicted amidohydrolase